MPDILETTSQSELVGLRPDTKFDDSPGEQLLVGHPWGVHRMRGVPPGLRARLERLCVEPVDVPTVDHAVARFLASFPFLVVRTILADGVPVLRLEPIAEAARPVPTGLGVGSGIRLSRFAYCRRLGEQFVVESPLALYRATLLAPELATILARLAHPCAVTDLAVDAHVLAELAGAGLLDVLDVADAGDEGERDTRLRGWSFHDLLFHTRSRSGRHDYPIGGTFPFGLDAPFPPAVKPTTDGAVVSLFRPDLADVAARDVSFTEVLESRRSIRGHGSRGMSADQLGEFLYRTMRVRHRVGPNPPDWPYQSSSRPYPGGGAAYEIEAYLVANRCEGLARGVYHYDPLDHRLHVVHGPGAELTDLLGSYRTGLSATPDVLFVLTCRFQRLNHKYESIPYGVALRDLGALYQTFYLTATSMGLAACAIGNGDIEVANRVLGLEFTEESSIGEFVLSSMPPDANVAVEHNERTLGPTFLDGHDSNWAGRHSRLFRRKRSA